MNTTYSPNKSDRSFLIIVIALLLTACGGGGGGVTGSGATTAPASAAAAVLTFDIKTFRFTWTDVADATFYRIQEDPDGTSGFTQVGGDIPQGTQSFDHDVPLFQRDNARYILQSCNANGCTDDTTITITGTLDSAIGYFKASNTEGGDEFGLDVTLSADGNTLAIGAKIEASNANTINGDQTDNSAPSTGAVYVYFKNAGGWSQQAYIKANNSAAGDEFGTAVSLSADGNTLAVGAPQQGATGTVYLFTRNGTNWTQQDSVKASVTGADLFGDAVSLSDDGSTLAVGARFEASEGTGLNADATLNGAMGAGAAYIFTVDNLGNWSQQQYFKADNADGNDFFGTSVSLSADGNIFAVGATGEDSITTGPATDSTASTNTASDSGAVYVFSRSGTVWTQQAYIKASNTGVGDMFGGAVSLSDDASTLAVGATAEANTNAGININETDNSASNAGAVYVFTTPGSDWVQQAYIKASNADADDNFGRSLSLSGDGNLLAAGAVNEQSNATGINGVENDNSINTTNGAGAAYVFSRSTGTWTQQAYVKANNTGSNDLYGISIELSGDGRTLVVGADTEDSNATTIGGDATDNNALGAGAAYLY